jgi:hypothetical protein
MIKLKIGGLTFSSLSLGGKNLGSIQNSAPSIFVPPLQPTPLPTSTTSTTTIGETWILTTGFWNDSGVWVDSANWID